MKKNVLGLLVLVSVVSIANADNWGRWRGPTGNGVALNAAPLGKYPSGRNPT